MPMLQTSYATKPLAGVVGRRANMEEWNTITRLAEDDGIGFGQPVQRGTEDDQVAIFDDGNFLGITEADQTLIDGAVGTDLEYPEGYNVPVCERGVIWVMAGGTATAGGLVYWDSATGRYSDDDGDTLIPGAEFDSSGGNGDLVKIRLRRATPVPVVEAGGGE